MRRVLRVHGQGLWCFTNANGMIEAVPVERVRDELKARMLGALYGMGVPRVLVERAP